jgi:hypothetical protein
MPGDIFKHHFLYQARHRVQITGESDAVLTGALAGWIFRVLNARSPPQSENPLPPAVCIPWVSFI